MNKKVNDFLLLLLLFDTHNGTRQHIYSYYSANVSKQNQGALGMGARGRIGWLKAVGLQMTSEWKERLRLPNVTRKGMPYFWCRLQIYEKHDNQMKGCCVALKVTASEAPRAQMSEMTRWCHLHTQSSFAFVNACLYVTCHYSAGDWTLCSTVLKGLQGLYTGRLSRRLNRRDNRSDRLRRRSPRVYALLG